MTPMEKTAAISGPIAEALGIDTVGRDDQGRVLFRDETGQWAAMPGAVRARLESAGLLDALMSEVP